MKSKNIHKVQVIKAIVYIIVFLIITTPLVFIYGPYENTRKTLIATILGTRHSYWLTDNFSEETINMMLGNEKKDEEKIEQKLENIEVKYADSDEIKEYRLEKSRFEAYIVEIKNPFKVKATMTKYLGKMGQRTSEMAEEKNAVAAINGGSFLGHSSDGELYAGTGGEPGGFVISDGKVIYTPEGYDDKTIENVAAINKYGKLIVGDHSLFELQNEYDVQEAMCFKKPNIIIDGKRQITNKLEDGLNPRTAIGQKVDGTIIFLVIDGRKLTMPGASLYDVQEIMAERGAINVGELDGGYSSTLYYKGEVINSPNSWDGERTVATAFYVEQ